MIIDKQDTHLRKEYHGATVLLTIRQVPPFQLARRSLGEKIEFKSPSQIFLEQLKLNGITTEKVYPQGLCPKMKDTFYKRPESRKPARISSL